MQRSLHKSLEEEAKNAVLCEKGLQEEIRSLKSQLAAKEKERVDIVETLHIMESRCISMEAKLEGKTKEYQNLKTDSEKLEKRKDTLKRRLLKRIRSFMKNAIVCRIFARIVMTNLERSLKMLVGS